MADVNSLICGMDSLACLNAIVYGGIASHNCICLRHSLRSVVYLVTSTGHPTSCKLGTRLGLSRKRLVCSEILLLMTSVFESARRLLQTTIDVDRDHSLRKSLQLKWVFGIKLVIDS